MSRAYTSYTASSLDVMAEGCHRLPMSSAIAIRTATAHDHEVLVRLAALDTAELPSGHVLLGAVDGEVQAAVEVATGRVVADPFRPTADLADLLRMRAARLSARAAGHDRRPRALLSRRPRRRLSVT
jgi:hypothetical protein